MISYRGNLKECFENAAKDMIWSKKEREILSELAKGANVKSMPCGTGRIYWVCGNSKYKFYVHASDVGFNIGRTK